MQLRKCDLRLATFARFQSVTLEARNFGCHFNNILDGRRARQPCQDIFSIPATYWKFGATYL
jgi:hypothetical protein